MEKKGSGYTILLIPGPNGGKTFSFALSRNAVLAAIAIGALLLLAAGFLTFAFFDSTHKARVLSELRKENTELLKENSEFQLLYRKIARMDTIATYLQQLSEPLAPPGALKSGPPSGEPSQPDTSVEIATDRTNGAAEFVPTTPPVKGWITQKYTTDTTRRGISHPGIDIAAGEGTPIVAAARGVIVDVTTEGVFGNMIVINHGHGFITRYGHCSKVLVSKNQNVARGQRIGLVGSTGHSSAPHLHYEVIRNGKSINPLGFIVEGK